MNYFSIKTWRYLLQFNQQWASYFPIPVYFYVLCGVEVGDWPNCALAYKSFAPLLSPSKNFLNCQRLRHLCFLYVITLSRPINNFSISFVLLCLLPRKKRGYAITSVRPFVCLFICLFVNRITRKLIDRFWWNLAAGQIMIFERTH